jgi:hypothetical protein
VEQILASHSEVEGLKELPHVATVIKDLNYQQRRLNQPAYPTALHSIEQGQVQALGRTYLDDVSILRSENGRFFTDKMPNNFEHIGLISQMLPDAKFIDVRRHPMANGFSVYRQLFNTGQEWSYRLEDIAGYYRNYLAYMAFWDEVLPNRVHRLEYEQLVRDTENTVRQMLDYLGLAFEPACLEFHTNRRPVKSASSEQVRQPVHDQALEYWKNFEQELEPLKAAFGQHGVDI